MNKYLDHNGLLYLWGKIKTLVSGKVDKVEGMGLSSNDFTAEEKDKLSGLMNYTLPSATKTQLGGIKVSSFNLPGETSVPVNMVMYDLHLTGDGLARACVGYATPTSFGVVKVGDGLAVTDGVLSVLGGGTADSVAWDNITGRPDVALKSDLASVYRFKGSVANFASLPTAGNETGDVWNVESTDMNYGWTGEDWDPLGQIFEIQAITNEEIDTIMGM